MTMTDQLGKEIDAIREKIPSLSADNAFVFWFLSAYLMDIDDPEPIKNCIVGAPRDVNIDACHIDAKNKKVFLVQAKFRENTSSLEKRNDIISFLDLENQLYEKLLMLYQNPELAQEMGTRARSVIKKNKGATQKNIEIIKSFVNIC